MKHFLQLLFFLAIVGAFLWPKEEHSEIFRLRKFLSIQESPILFVYGNPRSRTLKNFFSTIEQSDIYGDVDLHIALKNTTKSKLAPAYNVSVIPPDFSSDISENGYRLYFSDFKEPVFVGSILEGPEILEVKLLELFSPDNLIKANQLFPLGDSILNSPARSTIGQTFSFGSFSVFFLYENICMACQSGKTFSVIDEMLQFHEGVNAYFINIEPYGKKELDTFIKNHNITASILMARKDLQEFWAKIDQSQPGKHPLQGFILVLDRTGSIVFTGNNTQSLKAFLIESLPNGNRISGEH